MRINFQKLVMNYDIMNVGEYYTQVNEPREFFLFNSVRIYKNMHIAPIINIEKKMATMMRLFVVHVKVNAIKTHY